MSTPRAELTYSMNSRISDRASSILIPMMDPPNFQYKVHMMSLSPINPYAIISSPWTDTRRDSKT